MKGIKDLVLLMIIASMPFYVHADGFINGVKSVVKGVGQGAEDVGMGVVNAAGDVGKGIKNAVNGTDTKDNSDAGITSRVKAAIQDLDSNNQISSGYNLNVQTTNGIVNISGTVTNSSDAQTIKDKVTNMSGVKGLNTNITVKS